MNIEEKTKLAHDFAIMRMKNATVKDYRDGVALSWAYADLMEAEAEKRIKAKAEKDAEDAKVFFEKLTKNEDGSCKHFHTTLNRGECFDCGEKLNSTDSSQLEFQVDWSVAPEWANWWALDEDMETAFWYELKPILSKERWYFDYENNPIEGDTLESCSFNYQGDWKDSLRKRPQEKPKQHDCNCAHWKGSSFFMGDTFTCKDCGGSVTI